MFFSDDNTKIHKQKVTSTTTQMTRDNSRHKF